MICLAAHRTRHAGLTLLELLVVLAVIAILATIAAPNFQEMLKNNRVSSQTNEIIALLTFARSEAVRRSVPVTVNLSLAGTDSDAWVAEVLDPQTGNVLRRSAGRKRVQLESSDTQLTFNSRGYLAGYFKDTGNGGELKLDPDEWNPEGADLCLKHVNPSASGRQHRIMHILPSGQINTNSTVWNDCPPS